MVYPFSLAKSFDPLPSSLHMRGLDRNPWLAKMRFTCRNALHNRDNVSVHVNQKARSSASTGKGK